jgi:ABC-type sugar transport system ATPase subunit
MRDGLSHALKSPESGSETVSVISHDFLRTLSTADSVAAMRQGQIVHDSPRDGLSVRNVVAIMVGQEGDRAAG